MNLIRIEGIGDRMTGTTREGRPYDFIPLHVSYEDRRVHGRKVAEVAVDPADMQRIAPTLGEEFTVNLTTFKGRTRIDAWVCRGVLAVDLL